MPTMTKSRRGTLVAVAAIAVLAIAAACYYWLSASPGRAGRVRIASNQPVQKVQRAERLRRHSARIAGTNVKPPEENDQARNAEERPRLDIPAEGAEGWSAADRALAARLQAALDDGNFTNVLAAVREILAGNNQELRRQLPAALDWFGIQSLKELTEMLFDKDPQVAAEARDVWGRALDGIENLETKAEVLDAGLRAITDEDSLEQLVMNVNEMRNAVSLQILLNMISSDNPVAQKVAREHYEFVTGEEYTTPAAAQKWLDENNDESEEDSEGNEVQNE